MYVEHQTSDGCRKKTGKIFSLYVVRVGLGNKGSVWEEIFFCGFLCVVRPTAQVFYVNVVFFALCPK